MTGKGILVVHTYYHHYKYDRVDCYPIQNGQARLPYTTDVRVMPTEMFGYFSSLFCQLVWECMESCLD